MLLIIQEAGLIGWSVVGVLILSIALQTVIDKYFEASNIRRMGFSDKRGQKINEIINGVKIIKFTAWEKVMNQVTRSFRIKEGSEILKSFTLYNLSHAFTTMVPTAMALAVFSFNNSDSEKFRFSTIYELVNLFNATLTPIRYYILGTMSRLDAMGANKRICTLVELEQKEI